MESFWNGGTLVQFEAFGAGSRYNYRVFLTTEFVQRRFEGRDEFGTLREAERAALRAVTTLLEA